MKIEKKSKETLMYDMEKELESLLWKINSKYDNYGIQIWVTGGLSPMGKTKTLYIKFTPSKNRYD